MTISSTARSLRKLTAALTVGAVLVATAFSASAQIKVGITLSATGGAASIGSVERNLITLWPKTIAGQQVEYIVMDDGSEPGTAVRNVRKLTSEDKVDVLIGSSTSPNSMAMNPVAEETSTPLISMSSALAIVSPMDAQKHWVFKTVQNDASMIEAVLDDMARRGVKKIGYIGLADATGEGYLKALKEGAPAKGIEFTTIESYNRSDQSVAAQALRLVGSKPDAIYVASLGTPAALPQIALVERGYKGMIYHTGGVANNDFLRVAGPAAEGMYLPVGALLVYPQLPDSNPVKKMAEGVVKEYEAKFGANTRNMFLSYCQDSVLLLQNAAPAALAKAKPGTKEFRVALRDALEATKGLVTTNGVYTMTPTDHMGLDAKSIYIARVQNGAWTLAKDVDAK
jgi:branched-chain amino acid transport system substrate-binding protein